MRGGPLTLYRRTGADLPFGDPAAAHGVGMEGYYWRFTDAASGRVVVVLCGACRAPGGDWALVAVAAHPGGFVRRAIVDRVRLDGRRLGLRAGDALSAGPGFVRARIDGAEVEASIEPVLPWPGGRPFGGLGPAQMVPGLPQYWHPHLLSGSVRGAARLAGVGAWSLDGSTAYAEKNWGRVFAGHWWWGQASDLGASGVTVAFAGGRLRPGAPTAVVVATQDRVIRLSPPLARVVTATAPGRWHIRATGPLHSLELVGEADPAVAHVLPVPVVAERRAEPRSHQHLAGALTLTLRRGRRLLLHADTALAGLERGHPVTKGQIP